MLTGLGKCCFWSDDDVIDDSDDGDDDDGDSDDGDDDDGGDDEDGVPPESRALSKPIWSLGSEGSMLSQPQIIIQLTINCHPPPHHNDNSHPYYVGILIDHLTWVVSVLPSLLPSFTWYFFIVFFFTWYFLIFFLFLFFLPDTFCLFLFFIHLVLFCWFVLHFLFTWLLVLFFHLVLCHQLPQRLGILSLNFSALFQVPSRSHIMISVKYQSSQISTICQLF